MSDKTPFGRSLVAMPSSRSWDLAAVDLRKNAGESMKVCGSRRTAPPGETDRAAGLWFGKSMHGDVLAASQPAGEQGPPNGEQGRAPRRRHQPDLLNLRRQASPHPVRPEAPFGEALLAPSRGAGKQPPSSRRSGGLANRSSHSGYHQEVRGNRHDFPGSEIGEISVTCAPSNDLSSRFSTSGDNSLRAGKRAKVHPRSDAKIHRDAPQPWRAAMINQAS